MASHQRFPGVRVLSLSFSRFCLLALALALCCAVAPHVGVGASDAWADEGPSSSTASAAASSASSSAGSQDDYEIAFSRDGVEELPDAAVDEADAAEAADGGLPWPWIVFGVCMVLSAACVGASAFIIHRYRSDREF